MVINMEEKKEIINLSNFRVTLTGSGQVNFVCYFSDEDNGKFQKAFEEFETFKEQIIKAKKELESCFKTK